MLEAALLRDQELLAGNLYARMLHHQRQQHRIPDPSLEPFKRLAMVQIQPPPNPNKPLTPFSIHDILNGQSDRRSNSERSAPDHPRSRPAHSLALPSFGPHRLLHSDSRLFRSHPLRVRTPAPPLPDSRRFLRPWDDQATSPCSSTSDDNDEEIDIEDEKPPKAKSGVSPLDALFQMTSKTFDGRGADGSQEDGSRRDQMNIFSKSAPNSKKRRKSRTAFTNQQIYELEKRFLYQKYLTPADRDEIAQSLGLSNAQVITWFQNRRAKLKRDLEELKADVTAAKSLGGDSSGDDELMTKISSLEELQLMSQQGLKMKDIKKSTQVTNLAASQLDTSLDDVMSDTRSELNEDSLSRHGDVIHSPEPIRSPVTAVTSLASPDTLTYSKDNQLNNNSHIEPTKDIDIETINDPNDGDDEEIDV